MYVLVYARHGIVGEDESWAKVFDTYKEAHDMMYRDVFGHPERDMLSDTDITEWHATTYLEDSDGPEWHIYEV